jgi:hypothetical protein
MLIARHSTKTVRIFGKSDWCLYMGGDGVKVNVPMSDDTEIKLTPEEIARRATLPTDAREALEAADRRRAARLKAEQDQPKAAETGGPSGPEPTRYGDWERKGRVYDF